MGTRLSLCSLSSQRWTWISYPQQLPWPEYCCFGYRLHLFSAVLGMWLRALSILGNHLTKWATLIAPNFYCLSVDVFLHACLCTMYMPEEGIRCTGTGIVSGCEWLSGCWNRSRIFGRQPVSLPLSRFSCLSFSFLHSNFVKKMRLLPGIMIAHFFCSFCVKFKKRKEPVFPAVFRCSPSVLCFLSSLISSPARKKKHYIHWGSL